MIVSVENIATNHIITQMGQISLKYDTIAHANTHNHAPNPPFNVLLVETSNEEWNEHPLEKKKYKNKKNGNKGKIIRKQQQ